MISKIRCQKEEINTQVKVSDQGQLLRVLFHKLRIEEALKSGGETDPVNPDWAGEDIMVAKSLGGPHSLTSPRRPGSTKWPWAH